jgi:hypothetical protein
MIDVGPMRRLAILCLLVVPAGLLAAGGWVLMEPPETEVPGGTPVTDEWAQTMERQAEIDSRAPLSQWSQWKAFDSARECEAEIDRVREIRSNMLRAETTRTVPSTLPVESRSSYENESKRMQVVFRMALLRWNHARCLAASQVPAR